MFGDRRKRSVEANEVIDILEQSAMYVLRQPVRIWLLNSFSSCLLVNKLNAKRANLGKKICIHLCF